jgi:hypothetical protein
MLVAHHGKVRNTILYVVGDLEIGKTTCKLCGEIELKRIVKYIKIIQHLKKLHDKTNLN